MLKEKNKAKKNNYRRFMPIYQMFTPCDNEWRNGVSL